MPFPTTKTNEALQRILDQLPAAGPIAVPCGPDLKKIAGISMPWAERLRSTEEQLRMLSTAYPFTGTDEPA